MCSRRPHTLNYCPPPPPKPSSVTSCAFLGAAGLGFLCGIFVNLYDTEVCVLIFLGYTVKFKFDALFFLIGRVGQRNSEASFCKDVGEL